MPTIRSHIKDGVQIIHITVQHYHKVALACGIHYTIHVTDVASTSNIVTRMSGDVHHFLVSNTLVTYM